MASNSHNNNKENSSSWTRMQNKQFESALALYDQDTPDRWQNIAKVVGDKSAEEVKRHYEILLEDLSHIESGRVPIPSYKSTDNNEERSMLSEQYDLFDSVLFSIFKSILLKSFSKPVVEKKYV
ncbi:Protein RADIALIS-like 6 [Glycine soja]